MCFGMIFPYTLKMPEKGNICVHITKILTFYQQHVIFYLKKKGIVFNLVSVIFKYKNV